MNEFKIATVPTYDSGKNIQRIGGISSTYSGTIPPLSVAALLDLHFALGKIDKLAAEIKNPAEPWEWAKAEYYDSMTAETLLSKARSARLTTTPRTVWLT
jgi:hypothetical protein